MLIHAASLVLWDKTVGIAVVVVLIKLCNVVGVVFLLSSLEKRWFTLFYHSALEMDILLIICKLSYVTFNTYPYKSIVLYT